MQAIARIKYLKISPKKMRLVADLIKDKPVEDALNILNFTPRAAAHHLAKTVKAAAANAISGVGTAKLKAEDLHVSKVMVDSAPTAKRIRFQTMGRVYRIRKRYCHVLVEVEGEPEPETVKTKSRRSKKATEDKSESGLKKTAKGKTKKAGGEKKKVKSKTDDKETTLKVTKKSEKESETAVDNKNSKAAVDSIEEKADNAVSGKDDAEEK